MTLLDNLSTVPLIAVLRGIKPDEVCSVAEVLSNAGFRCLEVPLNSPDPFSSIRLMHKHYGDKHLIGAGTVLKTEQVFQVKKAGGRLIIMPHCDTEIIRLAKQQGLYCIPGASTITEVFNAYKAGADAVKLFPAELISPEAVKAYRAVLPEESILLPVGSITPQKMTAYFKAGANGFGLGGALYKAGDSLEAVALKAQAFIEHLPK